MPSPDSETRPSLSPPQVCGEPAWHILGGGSLGCLLASYLQLAGAAPRLLLRDRSSLDVAQAAGVSLQRDGAVERINGLALVCPDQLEDAVERLFVCTKAHQTITALDAMSAHLHKQPLVVLMQNGMGVREALLDQWPQATVLHAITTEGAFQTRRFQVVHAGRGDTLIGSVATGDRRDEETEIANAIARMLGHAGLAARAVDDCETRLWQKLAVNSVINPLTALYRCRNGELFAQPDAPARVAQLCREMAAVACASGMEMTAADLSERVATVARATAANRSSMLQDVDAGRLTEIDFINGFVVRKAHDLGIAVPAHEAVLGAVKQLTPA